jgi:hypothetical protein
MSEKSEKNKVKFDWHKYTPSKCLKNVKKYKVKFDWHKYTPTTCVHAGLANS